MDESSEVEDNIIVIMKRMDQRAQCFRLKEFNLHLRNNVRQIYNIYIYMKNPPFHSLVWDSFRLAPITERGRRGRAKGKIKGEQWQDQGHGQVKYKAGVSTEETEKLYNSYHNWGEPERAPH